MTKKVVVTAMSAAGKTFARLKSSFCDAPVTRKRHKFSRPSSARQPNYPDGKLEIALVVIKSGAEHGF